MNTYTSLEQLNSEFREIIHQSFQPCWHGIPTDPTRLAPIQHVPTVEEVFISSAWNTPDLVPGCERLPSILYVQTVGVSLQRQDSRLYHGYVTGYERAPDEVDPAIELWSALSDDTRQRLFDTHDLGPVADQRNWCDLPDAAKVAFRGISYCLLHDSLTAQVEFWKKLNPAGRNRFLTKHCIDKEQAERDWHSLHYKTRLAILRYVTVAE